MLYLYPKIWVVYKSKQVEIIAKYFEKNQAMPCLIINYG